MFPAVTQRPLVAWSPVLHGILLVNAPGPVSFLSPSHFPAFPCLGFLDHLLKELLELKSLSQKEFWQELNLKYECPMMARF